MTSRDLNVGDPVSKGQQLPVLDPTLLRLALVSLEGRPRPFHKRLLSTPKVYEQAPAGADQDR